MSTLRTNRIEPQTGDTIEVAGRLRFTDPQPGMQLASVNDIGVAGAQGFGVGICPNLPAGYSALQGTFDPASNNYGNYVYSDGSIMCWIPAFYYKWGTGSNGLPVNHVDIQPLHAYTSITAANSAGYALHRAFIDGGLTQAGVFVDKYQCSNNGGIASSVRGGKVMSTAAANAPIGSLAGAPANNYGGVLAAAKTRGADFFAISRFIYSALAMLAHAHGLNSTNAAFCAWYNPSNNFPKGNNNGVALNDINDPTLTFKHDGYVSGGFYPAFAGSGSIFAKTTHNGQECGIADVNGNLWDVTVGLTYSTAATAGTGYYVLKTSVAMKSLTGGNTLATDAFGATGTDANYDFAGASFGYASEAAGVRAHRFGNAANQVLPANTTGLQWQQAGLALPNADGAGSAGTSLFGNDYMYDRGPSLVDLCPRSGGGSGDGSLSGVWALRLDVARTASDASVGLRAGRYL